MPWKECHVVDERLRFVARLLDGEKVAALCAEFSISRKTGHKTYDRYKDCGVDGLTDRSRRPYRHANPRRPRPARPSSFRDCTCMWFVTALTDSYRSTSCIFARFRAGKGRCGRS